jgi:hypothetical protein
MKPETEAACHAALEALVLARDLLDAEGREVISADDPAELVRTYADLREQAEALRDSVANFSKMEQALSYDIIPSAFDRAGIQNIRVTGYGLVGLTRRWSCSFLEGKKEAGFAYLRENNQGGMIIETVPAPTLGAWAHAVTDETGVEPPDSIFKTSIARSVSLRRSA